MKTHTLLRYYMRVRHEKKREDMTTDKKRKTVEKKRKEDAFRNDSRVRAGQANYSRLLLSPPVLSRKPTSNNAAYQTTTAELSTSLQVSRYHFLLRDQLEEAGALKTWGRLISDGQNDHLLSTIISFSWARLLHSLTGLDMHSLHHRRPLTLCFTLWAFLPHPSNCF